MRRSGGRRSFDDHTDVRASHGRARNQGGFTLVELLIVITIIPLIVGSISLALIAAFSLQSSVSDRLGASGDAQAVAASFYQDVQSATLFTTTANPSSPGQCGSGPQLLGLQWSSSADSTTVVSYAITPNGVVTPLGVHEYNLLRLECDWITGSTPSLVASSILSFNVPGDLSACTNTTLCPAGPWSDGWTTTNGVGAILFTVNEAATNVASYDKACPPGIAFCYTVASAPRIWQKVGAPPPVSSLVPAEFLGSAGVNLRSCDSGNPTLYMNGEMVINSGEGPTVTGTKTNIVPTSVSYYAPGGVPPDIGGGATLTPIAQPMPDPLVNLPAPNMSGLPTDPPTKTFGSVTYAYPGIYTKFLGGTVTLMTGVYELRAGVGGTLTSGVGGNLLYVTGGQTSLVGSRLWPMATGPYAGVTVWQGPAVVDGVPNYDSHAVAVGSGSSLTQVDGVVYAPGADFEWHGDASIWVGTVLSKGMTCLGGGNGQLNIGFTQSVTFTSNPPPSGSIGTSYLVSAVSANTPNSGNPVTFSIDNLSTPGACSISGARVQFTGPGTCLVDARQAQSDQSGSGGGYLEAPTIQQSIVIGS